MTHHRNEKMNLISFFDLKIVYEIKKKQKKTWKNWIENVFFSINDLASIKLRKRKISVDWIRWKNRRKNEIRFSMRNDLWFFFRVSFGRRENERIISIIYRKKNDFSTSIFFHRFNESNAIFDFDRKWNENSIDESNAIFDFDRKWNENFDSNEKKFDSKSKWKIFVTRATKNSI